jgi:hypothetical protein
LFFYVCSSAVYIVLANLKELLINFTHPLFGGRKNPDFPNP